MILSACDGPTADSGLVIDDTAVSDTGTPEPLPRESGEVLLDTPTWLGEAGDGMAAMTPVGAEIWLASAQREDGAGAVCVAGELGPVEPCWTGRQANGFLGNQLLEFDGRLAAAAFWDGDSKGGAVFLLGSEGGGVDGATEWTGPSGAYAGTALERLDDRLVIGGIGGSGRVWVVDASGGALGSAEVRFDGGENLGYFGVDVATGDVDGDGVKDLLVGAMGEDNGRGAAYLFFGPHEGTRDALDADGYIAGETAWTQTGKTVELGDLDGDGLKDLVLSESEADTAHIFLGPGTSGVVSDHDAVVLGEGRFSFSMDAGDLDRDGTDDLVVGSTRYDESRGGAFLFYGPVEGSVEAADADWRLLGATASDKSGLWVGMFDHRLYVAGSGVSEGAGAVYAP